MNYKKKTKRILSILMMLTVLFTTTLPVLASDSTVNSFSMERAVPNFAEQRPVVIRDSSPNIQFTGNWVSFTVHITNPSNVSPTDELYVSLKSGNNTIARIKMPNNGSNKTGNAWINPGSNYYFEYETGSSQIIWFAIGAASANI